MQDNKLFSLSLILSFLGIVLLLFISENISPKKMDISSITRSQVDKDVVVAGKIVSVENKNSLLLLTLKDETDSIDVVVFEPEGIVIKSGQDIKVTGKVALYRNKLELIARSIDSS